MFVKICGIKTPEMADIACLMGADAVGVIAHKKSRRYVTPEQALSIKNAIKGRCPLVAVGVELAECAGYAGIADMFQADDANSAENHILSGHEEPHGIFRYFIYDKSRGSGEKTEYPSWVAEYSGRLILAGGLDSSNVADIIKKYRPFGVDVSTGVETDGEKDPSKIRDFINNAKKISLKCSGSEA
jgi:phosphoribosylanthranilate isomerase